MDKSFVTFEQKKCKVCGIDYNTDTILMDKKMSDRFDMHTVTGWGVCPEHARMRSQGFVSLIEIDPTKSNKSGTKGLIKPEDAYRTGNIAYLQKDSFVEIFNVVLPLDMICFIDSEVTKLLKHMTGDNNDSTH